MAVIQPTFDPTLDQGSSPILGFFSAFLGERSEVNKAIMKQRLSQADPAYLSELIVENQKAIANLQEMKGRMQLSTNEMRGNFVRDTQQGILDITQAVESSRIKSQTDLAVARIGAAEKQAEIEAKQLELADLTGDERDQIRGLAVGIADATNLATSREQMEGNLQRNVSKIATDYSGNPFKQRAALSALRVQVENELASRGTSPQEAGFVIGALRQVEENAATMAESSDDLVRQASQYGASAPSVSQVLQSAGLPTAGAQQAYGGQPAAPQAAGATAQPAGAAPPPAGTGGQVQGGIAPSVNSWMREYARENIPDVSTTGMDAEIDRLKAEQEDLYAQLEEAKTQGPVQRMFMDFNRNYLLETPFKRQANQKMPDERMVRLVEEIGKLPDEQQVAFYDALRRTPEGPGRLMRAYESMSSTGAAGQKRLSEAGQPDLGAFDRTPVSMDDFRPYDSSRRSINPVEFGQSESQDPTMELARQVESIINSEPGETRDQLIDRLEAQSRTIKTNLSESMPTTASIASAYLMAIEDARDGDRGDFGKLKSDLKAIKSASMPYGEGEAPSPESEKIASEVSEASNSLGPYNRNDPYVDMEDLEIRPVNLKPGEKNPYENQ